MFKKSLFYYNSFFYILSLKLLHKCDISLRNKFIVGLLKKGETLLEPGCGPAILADYLPEGVNYLGFDLNEKFISDASNKGIGVYLGNVLERKSYKESDLVLICDVFHHIDLKNRSKLIAHSYSSAKRVFVFCECIKEVKGWKKILHPLAAKIFEFFDRDGINTPKYDHVYTRNDLQKEIENGFGVIPKNKKRVTREFGCDLLAVFYK